jgi:hypothetical protein
MKEAAHTGVSEALKVQNVERLTSMGPGEVHGKKIWDGWVLVFQGSMRNWGCCDCGDWDVSKQPAASES